MKNEPLCFPAGIKPAMAGLVITFTMILLSQVSVQAAPTLLHRYSFNDPGSSVVEDSIAGADGALYAGASQSGGSVVLTGASDSFVALPGGLISASTISRDAVTFETWARFGDTGVWSRMFNFGDTNGVTGRKHIAFVPKGPPADFGSMQFNTSDPIGKLRIRGNLANLPADPAEPDLHIVCIADYGNDRASIYLDGVWLADAIDFSTVDLADLVNNFSYLGKSVNPADPNLIGSINEFRIYDGAMDPLEVAASYEAGPDVLDLDAGDLTAIELETLTLLRVGGVAKTRAHATASGLTDNPIDVTGEPELSYASDDPAVLAVKAEGVLTALAEGTATITVTHTEDGIVVSDSKPVEVIAVDYETVELPRLTHDVTRAADGSAYDPLFPGSQIFANVPFELQEDEFGNNRFYGDTPGMLDDGILEIPVEAAGVVEVYTLISVGWGFPGETVGYVRFEGSGGLVHTVDLVAGVNVRDQFLNLIGPFVNFTTDLSTTEYVFGDHVPSTAHLDMQSFTLPVEFRAATLEKITFASIAPGGDHLLGKPWLVGMTMGASTPLVRPTAAAGPDQSIRAGDVVALDGSASYDDDTAWENLIYSWSFASLPQGSVAVMADADTAAPSFTADVAGDYEVELVVTDMDGLQSDPDIVVVSSNNQAPTAVASIDHSLAIIGQPSYFDGSASTDPEGDSLTYSWAVTSAPTGSTAALSGADNATPKLTPDLEGNYEVTLTVSDFLGPGMPATVAFTAVSPESYAEFQILAASDFVDLLVPAAEITNRGNKRALSRHLAIAIDALMGGDTDKAVHMLEQAIRRTDGCALRGSPDGDGPGRDWIIDCAIQHELFNLLVSARDALTP